MYEINKLRTRLKNINKNTVEYRMTVAEAKALVAEFDTLEKLANKPAVEVIKISESVTKILDGGTF